MKRFSRLLFYACLLLFLPGAVFAQKIDYPERFQSLLTQAGIEFYEPLDAGYRDIYVPENEYQNCDFAMRSTKEDLQIRYCILPWNEGNEFTQNPHVAAFRAVSSVATNNDEAVISSIQPDEETLRKDFNADWGVVYFFHPKPGFSDKPHCRMTALFKEGKGTVFIFHLFDEPGNEALDTRYLALRFF